MPFTWSCTVPVGFGSSPLPITVTPTETGWPAIAGEGLSTMLIVGNTAASMGSAIGIQMIAAQMIQLIRVTQRSTVLYPSIPRWQKDNCTLCATIYLLFTKDVGNGRIVTTKLV